MSVAIGLLAWRYSCTKEVVVLAGRPEADDGAIYVEKVGLANLKDSVA